MAGDEVREPASTASQTGWAVVGSHPVKCAAGHDAVALVWSDGRVEVVCPACGRYELSDRRAARETETHSTAMKTGCLGDTWTPSAKDEVAAELEDTQPLPVLDEVAAAAEIPACAPETMTASELTPQARGMRRL